MDGGELAGEGDELFGIGCGFGARENGVVAGAFGFQRELAPGDPDERMEPIRGADDAGETMREPIGAADVFEFVRDGAIQIGVVPIFSFHGEDNGRMKNATRHRTWGGFVEQRLDAAVDLEFVCERGGDRGSV